MDVAIGPVILLLPAVFTVVCVVGFLQARREGRRRRATLFAIGLIIGVLLAVWAWLEYGPPSPAS